METESRGGGAGQDSHLRDVARDDKTISTRKSCFTSTPQLGSTGCDRIISQYDDDPVIFYQAVEMKMFHVTRAEINQCSN